MPLHFRHNTPFLFPACCLVPEIMKPYNRFSRRATNRTSQQMFNLSPFACFIYDDIIILYLVI